MTVNNNINQLLFNNTNNVFGSQGTNNSQWRSGVTGWQPSNRSSGTSSNQGGLPAREAQSYLRDVKEIGARLNTATSNLMSGDSVLNQVTGSTSDNDTVTVNVTNQNEAQRFLRQNGSMDIEVNQLATAQQNRGDGLTANASGGFQGTTNIFAINDGDRDFTFVVSVRNNENISNREMQQKTNESTLVLTGRETGERNDFTVRDVSSDAVSRMGIGDATTEAQDARFTINGSEERTSATNTVNVGNGLSATLRQTTEAGESVQIGAARDSTAINNAVRDLVNNFNQLREAAVNNNSDRGAQSLQQRLDSLSRAFSNTLSGIGITQNQNGYLQINEERLSAAIENGSVERALGSDSSFTQNLSRVARAADTNPSSFVSRQSRDNINQQPTVNDNDFFDNIRLTPWQQNLTNRWNTVGLLFSMGV
jgi:flagellar capping protein FliD